MGESVKKGHEKSSPKGHESCRDERQLWKRKKELLSFRMDELGPINKSYKQHNSKMKWIN